MFRRRLANRLPCVSGYLLSSASDVGPFDQTIVKMEMRQISDGKKLLLLPRLVLSTAGLIIAAAK